MFNSKRLAIAATGFAALFGPSLAAAQNTMEVNHINYQRNATTGAAPVAIETIPANGDIDLGIGFGSGRVRIFVDFAISATDSYFLRAVLDGAVWRASGGNLPTLTPQQQPNWLPTLVEGGAGKNRLVYKLGGAVNIGTSTRSTIALAFFEYLRVLNHDPGDVSVTISLHTDQFDAIEGRNALSSQVFGGTATIIRKVVGLDIQVNKGAAAVADVATRPVGFLWFLNRAGNRFNGGNTGTGTSGANTSNVKLGFAQVAVNSVGPLNASNNGRPATIADMIAADGYSVTVDGNLSIGAFDLARQTGSGSTTIIRCPQRRGSSTSPGMGDLGPPASTDTTPRSQTARVTPANAGRHHLCLEVDNAGAGTNRTPIAAQEYKGTISYARTTPGLPVMKVEGVIGQIVRNGTAANLPFLTVDEKYNQRLIIVNRGPTPATYELGGFTTDATPGLSVALSDAAKSRQANGQNQVPAGDRVELRVADLLKFTGASGAAHAAAVLSLNAQDTHIQVATTQVNLQDGSTDTVVYPTINSMNN